MYAAFSAIGGNQQDLSYILFIQLYVVSGKRNSLRFAKETRG
jgi:hypothetical protein